MDREQYVKEVNWQLEDQEFYRLLEEPIYMDSVEVIKKKKKWIYFKRRLPHKPQVEHIILQGGTKREVSYSV